MCTERSESLLESADGSMATVATRREKGSLFNEAQTRIDLTPTGLLMEGDYTNHLGLEGGRRVGPRGCECTGDFSPITTRQARTYLINGWHQIWAHSRTYFSELGVMESNYLFAVGLP
jgi:hypothetical protein